jgi:hypothetical protein
MSAKFRPAISRVSSAGGSGVPTDPGGPPKFAVGAGVGRPGSDGEGWSGIGDGRAVGDDDGASLRVAASGPQATMPSRTLARIRVPIARSLATRQSRGPNFADAEIKKIRISWRCPLPPRGVKSAKRKRQYEHIKKSEAARGRSNKTAERIAAATTNKTRAKKGEAKSSRKKKTSSRRKSS